MTPNTSKKRRQMIERTEVLWSTVTYVPVILFGILALSVINPWVAPFEGDSKPAPMGFVIGLIVFAVVIAPFIVRSMVWRPLRQLAKDCGTPEVFRTHCKRITREALPFVPLMSLPVILLCINISGWFFMFQLGAFLLADHLADKWRKQPIVDSVDALLSR